MTFTTATSRSLSGIAARSTARRATSAGSACATSNRDSLLIDWRAPAAAVFYQATAAEPQGVVRRRVLRCAGAHGRRRRGRAARRRGRDRPADRRRGRADGAALPGPRPLDALDRRDHPGRAGQGDPRARQGRRRRSPAARAPARPSSRCTARRTCSTPTGAATRAAACSSSARRGVFMRYIERVLPSLGETAVALRSLGEVVDGVRATRHDEPAVADVKGSARMAELMRRTARQAGARRARASSGSSTATT